MTSHALILLIGLLAFTASHADSGSKKIYKSLICEFYDRDSEFTIETDLKSENEFFEEGKFTLDGISSTYPLSQKQSGPDEIYHFILNEKVLKSSVRVRVFNAQAEDLPATATLLGVKPKPADVSGFCVLL